MKNLKFKPSDVQIISLVLTLIFVIFILHPETWASFSLSDIYGSVLAMLKVLILSWILPSASLIIALLAYKNIVMTKESMQIAKESIGVSENTLKQMQVADQKNTSPMLKFSLSVAQESGGSFVTDEDRPREIKLWEAKATPEEKENPHYLRLSLENIQEHPHGVAAPVHLLISITFNKCEEEGGKSSQHKEEIEVDYAYMDSKEKYEQNIIKVSGLPKLVAKIEKISYTDMFEQTYVIGYGFGRIIMNAEYKFQRFFTAMTGKSPD